MQIFQVQVDFHNGADSQTFAVEAETAEQAVETALELHIEDEDGNQAEYAEVV